MPPADVGTLDGSDGDLSIPPSDDQIPFDEGDFGDIQDIFDDDERDQ